MLLSKHRPLGTRRPPNVPPGGCSSMVIMAPIPDPIYPTNQPAAGSRHLTCHAAAAPNTPLPSHPAPPPPFQTPSRCTHAWPTHHPPCMRQSYGLCFASTPCALAHGPCQALTRPCQALTICMLPCIVYGTCVVRRPPAASSTCTRLQHGPPTPAFATNARL